MSTVDVTKSPIANGASVYDNSSGVSPCIVMKNDGVLYHQMSMFSLELWTKVVLQERAVVGSVYRVPWRFSITPLIFIRHTENHLHGTMCRAHYLGRGEPGLFHLLDSCFKFGSYEGAQVSCTAMIRRSKSSLLHLGNFVEYPTLRKFEAT